MARETKQSMKHGKGLHSPTEAIDQLRAATITSIGDSKQKAVKFQLCKRSYKEQSSDEEEDHDGDTEQEAKRRRKRLAYPKEHHPMFRKISRSKGIHERHEESLNSARAKRDHLRNLFRSLSEDQRQKDDFLSREAQSKVISGELSFEEAEMWLKARRATSGNVLKVLEMLNQAENVYKELEEKHQRFNHDESMMNHELTDCTHIEPPQRAPSPAQKAEQAPLDNWQELSKALPNESNP